MKPRKTRKIKIGTLTIGGDSPIAVQSMTATRTQDLQATAQQIKILEEAGADIIRIAVDDETDIEALKELRKNSSAVFSVDLQENYRLADKVAPLVDKIRYNPGHLFHLDKDKSILGIWMSFRRRLTTRSPGTRTRTGRAASGRSR